MTSAKSLPMIVIVDDDDSLRAATRSLVRSLGYEVHDYGNAEDFLASGDADRAACLITDVNMPGLSGIDLKHALAGRGCSLPVLLMTASTDENILDRAACCGAIRTLRKPFDCRDLIDTLEAAVAAP
ncbi:MULTISPECIES: response regulator transcription factor [Sphingomonadales]|uniref:Transcriptional regulatory protein TdiR n=2 Tax=Edaphosphingomonas TaxID=3423724 RepID=A0A1S1HC12_9SPHN|nr:MULTISPECIES: response regulator [Sphingomonas]AGH51246.1 putative transcriptional regulator ycf27 OmpR-like protein [Sphingomonas sp. MM-1]MDX3884691.1 response regulator [Sphingomonas sp.]OHT19779.1 Transcriptional regulatory protein TdiR [Sphingomonas haloaromaticamans]